MGCESNNTPAAQFVVKRRGMPLFEYGLVDAATVRSQRMQPVPGCPVPLSLLEEYEGFINEYRKQVSSCTLDNELDLGTWCSDNDWPCHPPQRTCRRARCWRRAAFWGRCGSLATPCRAQWLART